MTNLVEEFFKRDLTEAEAQALEDLLGKSPEEALRFGGKLKAEYFAMGLPEPEMPRHLGPQAPGGGTPWLSPALWTAAVLGAGTLAWFLWPKPPALTAPRAAVVLPVPAEARVPVRPPAPLPPPPLTIPRRLNGSAVAGNRLSVVVELDGPAPVRVDILDSRSHTVRQLYQGSLPAGKWALHWDGLLSDGSKAPAGNYRIQVKSGSTEMSKAVAIEPSR